MTGVENVQGGLSDGTVGHVVDAKGDRQGEMEVYHFVGGIVLEVEGIGTCDVGCLEGGPER